MSPIVPVPDFLSAPGVFVIGIIVSLFTIVGGVLTAYRWGVKAITDVRDNMMNRIDTIEEKIAEIKVDIAKNYASLPQVEALVQRLDNSVNKLSDRLDSLGKEFRDAVLEMIKKT